jgi:endonuclease V-like protein UPF0215 family
MIEPEFEIDILIEDKISQEPIPTPAMFNFNDIEYYYKETYKGVEITVMKIANGEEIMANFRYEIFKKKYRERKAEIIASLGNRP